MIFAHIVTYNSAEHIEKCLSALLACEGFALGTTLQVALTDNGSRDGCVDIVRRKFVDKIKITENKNNFGFCAAHNQGVRQFLDSEYQYFLILNPDLRLEKNTLRRLLAALQEDNECGSATPRILRADENLDAVLPHRLDGAGMELTLALRHFDRASEQADTGQFLQNEHVFGGSGACLLLKRALVEDLLLEGPYDQDLWSIYPQLRDNAERRAALLDEAFFAYREDADLAWRAQNLGWKCLFVAGAGAYHVRKVLPERRSSLSKEINRWSVRNRFLLQLNNYSAVAMPAAFLPGILWRNLLVLIAVLTVELSSAGALAEVLKLLRRALARRKIIKARAAARGRAFWNGRL